MRNNVHLQHKWLWPSIIIFVGLLGIAATIWFVFKSSGTEQALETTQQEKQKIEEPAKDASDAALALCARNDDVARALRNAGVCQASEDVRKEVNRPSLVEPIQGEPGRPPTAGEIRSAVADYLRDNPPPAGLPPTAAEVANAVADYLSRNPPEPGRPPTTQEIANAVTNYCANDVCAGPQGERGLDGQPGAAGRPPTQEEIRASVETYCQSQVNQTCVGPQGPQGPEGQQGATGPHWIPVRAEFATTDDGACVYRVAFRRSDRPNDASIERVVAAAAPQQMCLGQPNSLLPGVN